MNFSKLVEVHNDYTHYLSFSFPEVKNDITIERFGTSSFLTIQGIKDLEFHTFVSNHYT